MRDLRADGGVRSSALLYHTWGAADGGLLEPPGGVAVAAVIG
jgi:hypothetical protein